MGMDEAYVNYLNNETKICALAFNHVDYTNNGEWRLCCKGDAIATKAHYDTIEEFWNGDEAKEVRKSMIENRFHKICDKNCYKHENSGYPNSHRQKANVNFVRKHGKNALEKKIKFGNEGELDLTQLNSIELRISNLCNLKCRMCSPKYSTNLNKEWIEVFKFVEKTIPLGEEEKTFHYKEEGEKYKKNPLMRLEYDEVKQILNTTKFNLQGLLFTGGEPFMEPYMYEAIKLLLPAAKNIDLQFVTNGTKLNNIEEFNYLFKEFLNVNIDMSCDGIGDTYDYIRQGSTWELFSDQAILISNYNVKLNFHLVVQTYNYNNITKMVDWVLDNFKDAAIRFTVLDNPWYLSVYCLPKDIKEKMKNELISYANNILNSKKRYNVVINKKMLHDDLIKISNKIDYKQHQKFINQFAAVSDRYDEVQNVKITWRQLLPELNESLKK